MCAICSCMCVQQSMYCVDYMRSVSTHRSRAMKRFDDSFSHISSPFLHAHARVYLLPHVWRTHTVLNCVCVCANNISSMDFIQSVRASVRKRIHIVHAADARALSFINQSRVYPGGSARSRAQLEVELYCNNRRMMRRMAVRAIPKWMSFVCCETLISCVLDHIACVCRCRCHIQCTVANTTTVWATPDPHYYWVRCEDDSIDTFLYLHAEQRKSH